MHKIETTDFLISPTSACKSGAAGAPSVGVGLVRAGGIASSPAAVLLQRSEFAGSTVETRAVSLAAMFLDIPIHRTGIPGLAAHARALVAGTLLPVGSVEFVRAALAVAGFAEPRFATYPECLRPYLMRTHRRASVADLPLLCADTFVKPLETKRFSGFVLRHGPYGAPGAPESDYAFEQLAAIARCHGTTPVWLAEPVAFACEWRFYMDASGELLAGARYDDGADDAPVPDARVVASMAAALVGELAALGTSAPFALDVGVLESLPGSPNDPRAGMTALVEATDGWACGLYTWAEAANGRPWHQTGYLKFLWDRWTTIAASGKAGIHDVTGAARLGHQAANTRSTTSE